VRDQAMKEIFLRRGFDQKVRRFVRLRLVSRDGNGGFICRPLPGNKQTYHIMHENGALVCREALKHTLCDGYLAKMKRGPNPSCSHCEAVRHVFPEVNQGVLFQETL